MGPMNDGAVTQHYQHAMGEITRELRNPLLQRQVFSLAQASPRQLVRSKLSTSELQHRALTYLPDEMLRNIPENSSPFSLFQGFQATLPETEQGKRRKHGRHQSRSQKLLEEKADDPSAPAGMKKLRKEKEGLEHKLEMMEVRKNMCSTEIREIDGKIANLNTMRGIVLDRLANLEQEETDLEQELLEMETNMEDMQEELDDNAALSGQKTPTQGSDAGADDTNEDSPAAEASFMSESIYEKIPSPKAKRPKPGRRKTTHILHEHLQAGSKIRQIQAHEDYISAMDFDVPFGTMITAALDDTVRVWDLNAGHCVGLLEGHLSSVRCLQVEDNLVATGSMDATVRLWDLNQADTAPPPSSNNITKRRPRADSSANHSDTQTDDNDDDEKSQPPPASNMRDCAIHTLSAHVAEITALHLHNNTLVSGSADKTLRQWDLTKGRCVQTLDVLWAAAQASSTISTSTLSASAGADAEPNYYSHRPSAVAPLPTSSRAVDASADFVGALQCFDAALACGTADGLVRLWDLRSGQVHRSLVGHTGPVTCLQFDDTHMVTGSVDRSVRVSDVLRLFWFYAAH